ncbi:unnamed protein product [Lathyrus sativus]|nr:unnamed protein product [Lathyrus sativus]
MACDATFPSTITCITLFFSLLLAFHFIMAVQEHTLTPSTKDDRSNNMVATSTNERNTQNFKTNIPDLQKGHPKGRKHSRASRPSFQWKNKIFNDSEHEVPSGPNPISNR